MSIVAAQDPAGGALVVAVDVGSVRGSFAWAALANAASPAQQGTDPEGLSMAVLHGLNSDQGVALGFESPLSVPVPPTDATDWKALGRARAGEGNRSWSAGAGAAVLATGLVEVAWVLARVASLRPDTTITVSYGKWRRGEADLLIWEALVTGGGKPDKGGGTQHAADALAAADAFAALLEVADATSALACAPMRPLNLAVIAALHAGLACADALDSEVLVVRTRGS